MNQSGKRQRKRALARRRLLEGGGDPELKEAELVQTLTLAVGSQHGPRSGVWTFSMQGQELYVRYRSPRLAWKISLHSSGVSHVKSLCDPDPTAGPWIKTHSRDTPPGEHPVALTIIIPDACLRPASDVDAASIPAVWLERPPYDGFTMLAIAEWVDGRDDPEWELRDSVIWAIKASKTRYMLIALVQLQADHPAADDYRKIMAEFMAAQQLKPIKLDSPERRAVYVSTNRTNGLIVLEVAID